MNPINKHAFPLVLHPLKDCGTDVEANFSSFSRYKIPSGSELFVHYIEEMEAPLKFICLLTFLVILGVSSFIRADGAGECGKSTTPDREAFKLAPCASAAQSENAPVSSLCCAQVKKIGQNPACLCAVMLSNTAKSSGVNPEAAVTIPKRCNFADRPVGYKCGRMFIT